MKPDFSSTSYVIQTRGFAKETYQYLLEHVSNKINKDDLLREQNLHKELYFRHSQYLKNIVGNEFKMVSLFTNIYEKLMLFESNIIYFIAFDRSYEGSYFWRDNIC